MNETEKTLNAVRRYIKDQIDDRAVHVRLGDLWRVIGLTEAVNVSHLPEKEYNEAREAHLRLQDVVLHEHRRAIEQVATGDDGGAMENREFRLATALEIIAGDGCITEDEDTCRRDPAKRIDGFPADRRWCHQCIAQYALDGGDIMALLQEPEGERDQKQHGEHLQ